MITNIQKYPPFKFKGEPWEHQKADFELSKDLPYYGFFWEMGCGKSKPIIDTACHLFLKQEIDGVVIVSDKGCYMSWPNDQIPKHMHDYIPHRVAYWSSHMKKDEMWKAQQLLTAKDDCLDFLCVNIEALASDRAYEFVEKFIRSHYCLMVVDEATSIKNPKAQRTLAAWKLGRMCDYRRIATGTPITQGPLDLFAQCEFLQPGCLGDRNFVSFRNRYAIQQQVVLGPRRFNKIVGYQNLELLQHKIRKFTSRRLKSECLDLPEKVYEMCYVEQTPEQEEAYRKLKEEAVLQFQQGLLTSTSALTTIGKLHQINCGHVKLDDDTTIEIPSNRISAMLEVIEKIPENQKVTIWGYYQKDIELITRALCEKYGPDSYVTYYGETKADERVDARMRFANDTSVRFWVGTPGAGGKGINELVVSCYVIYYSNHYNLERRLQSEDRNHRPGQKNNVTYTDMAVPKTVDVKIIKRLLEKKDLATEILDSDRLLGILNGDDLDLLPDNFQ